MASKDNTPLKVAVIEGWHPFDVVGFHTLFRSIEGIDPYHQSIENWAIDTAGVKKDYDVLVFYNMNQKIAPECDFCRPALEATVKELGENPNQGIVVLHHALLAYPESEEWTQLVGIPKRAFGFYGEQTFPIEVAAPDHPVVRGLSNWEMFDETYTMDSAGPDSEVLLATKYEKSMKSIGWARKYRNARVLCFQLGHDARSWVYPEFKKVLSQGIQWAAGRI